MGKLSNTARELLTILMYTLVIAAVVQYGFSLYFIFTGFLMTGLILQFFSGVCALGAVVIHGLWDI